LLYHRMSSGDHRTSLFAEADEVARTKIE
jgi:hypothetical protein